MTQSITFTNGDTYHFIPTATLHPWQIFTEGFELPDNTLRMLLPIGAGKWPSPTRMAQILSAGTYGDPAQPVDFAGVPYDPAIHVSIPKYPQLHGRIHRDGSFIHVDPASGPDEVVRVANDLNGSNNSLSDVTDNDSLVFCEALDAIVLQCEVCGTWGDTDSDVKYVKQHSWTMCNDCEAEVE